MTTNKTNDLPQIRMTGAMGTDQINQVGDGWISVEERLPEVGADVLLGNPFGLWATAVYVDDGSGVYFEVHETAQPPTFKATHWRPLPAPPKAKPTTPTQPVGVEI